MAVFNQRYGLENPVALVGMVADARLTHTVTVKAAGAIAAGQPVGYDGLVAATIGTPLKGVARLDGTLEQDSAGAIAYASGDPVPLVSFGPIWVQASKAVTAGDLAYAIISGADKGKFTDTSAATTTTDPVGWFENTTTAAADAILFVQRLTAVGGA